MTVTPRTPEQALAAAAYQSAHGPTFGVGECLERCHDLYGIPTDGTPTAAQAWARAQYRHMTTSTDGIPLGALLFWLGTPDGHVAIYAGHGMCWSTDILRPGRFDLVAVTMIAQKWGPQHKFVGWDEDVDGVRFLTPPKPAARPDPVVVKARAVLVPLNDPAMSIPRRRAYARARFAIARAAVTPLAKQGGTNS